MTAHPVVTESPRPDPTVSTTSRVITSLRDGLFRAEGQSRSRSWAAMPALVLVIATGLALLRGGPGIYRVWAEDGAVFYPEERQQGYATVLLHGYEGYLHLVPRTLTAIAAALPLRDLAVGLSAGAAVVTGLVAALLSRALAAYCGNRWLAVGLAMLLPLSPLGLSECLNAVCNIQWFLAAGCFWALIWCPPERRWLVASSVLVFLTAGSAPLVLAIAPLAVLRLVLTRGRQWSVALAYLAGSALQLHAMAHSTRTGIVHPDSLLDLAKTTAARLFTTSWLGVSDSQSLYHSLGWGAVGLALLLWLLVIGACLRSARSLWLLAGSLVSGSLLFLAGTYNNFATVSTAGGKDLALVNDGRYAVSTGALMVMAAVAALVMAVRSSRLAVPVLGVVAVVLVSSVVVDFHYTTPRDVEVSWSQTVSNNESHCRSDPAGVADLAVAPAANFDLTLSCADLLHLLG